MAIKSYKELTVWQKSIDLVLVVYELTEAFPKTEIYGLTSQIRRSVISIPSNIAEGSMRGTRNDYRHFLFNSLGSGAELETQIIIAKKLSFGIAAEYEKVESLLSEIMKMLRVLIKNLSLKPNH